MRRDNYDITLSRSAAAFAAYDQGEMISAFRLKHDAAFLYVDYFMRPHRIDRASCIVEAETAEGWQPADFDSAMTIYDVLSRAAARPETSGRFLPLHALRGTVSGSLPTTNMLDRAAERFAGRVGALEAALDRLGQPLPIGGDAAYCLQAFRFLPLTLQFWDADDEFPASFRLMFDENTPDFMHIETIYYMMSSLMRRIGEGDAGIR